MKGMLTNKKLLERGSSRVLRWALWLDGFDFEIAYKAGTENCLADILTRQGAEVVTEVKMFHFGWRKQGRDDGASSSNTSVARLHVDICSNCIYKYC